MQSDMRLKKTAEFKKVYHYGESIANRELVLYVMERPNTNTFRFGISVSKKIGNAVIRNRVKRLIKEVIRSIMVQHQLKEHKDIVIIARAPTANMNYADFDRSLKHLFRKMRLFI